MPDVHTKPAQSVHGCDVPVGHAKNLLLGQTTPLHAPVGAARPAVAQYDPEGHKVYLFGTLNSVELSKNLKIYKCSVGVP